MGFRERIKKVYIGIDPGKSGAIAIIDGNQLVRGLYDCPGDEFLMAEIINEIVERYPLIKGAVERAQSMPQQGVKSMFTYGTNYGFWRGILAANKIPFILPTPQMWQKGVISKAEDKKPAISAAARMFPDADIIGPRGGAKDGRADALLIADYCRRQYSGLL